MFDLSGKTALVTGASGSIGGAVARALHAQGATVAISGTRADALERLAGDLGDRVHVAVGNLAEPDGPDVVFKAAETALGHVDILVNNAGLTRDTLAMRMKDEDWKIVLDVNLTAAFRLSRAALRTMMKRRWGRVIGMTSVVGVTGNPGQANYAAAKAGMIGMSKSLAHEFATRNITVNCVAPGYIETPMTDVLPDGQKQKLLSVVPAGRFGASSEIAAGVVFLASEEAAYITGQTLHINGGMAMI